MPTLKEALRKMKLPWFADVVSILSFLTGILFFYCTPDNIFLNSVFKILFIILLEAAMLFVFSLYIIRGYSDDSKIKALNEKIIEKETDLAECKEEYEKIIQNSAQSHAELIQGFFKSGLFHLVNVFRDQIEKLFEEYAEFFEKLDHLEEEEYHSSENATVRETDTGIDTVSEKTKLKQEEIRNEFYNRVKQIIKEFFREVTDCVKSAIENILAFKGEREKINVSIMQLSYPYNSVKKKSRVSFENLKFFKIYIDRDSFYDRRELHTAYSVNGNEPYKKCITKENITEAVYIANNFQKLSDAGIIELEGRTDSFNSIAVVPIYNVVNTEYIYYGFLEINAENKSGKELFVEKEIAIVLQTYANLVASFYLIVEIFFPESFEMFCAKEIAGWEVD